ncbi:unnamed protein product [Mytilus coruscus]|uniref:Reverse transcriptase RNase H-like domain-containing protein n=1 Tax=Mytilus coruscus TaxID=42192 RepID=A0A6J8AFV3_MYTCO|nr:unnamed protein product [Mytilus coruscus]
MAENNIDESMSERNNFAEMVKRHTKEIYKIKSGKVSETVGNHDTDLNTRSVINRSSDTMRMSAESGMLRMSGIPESESETTGSENNNSPTMKDMMDKFSSMEKSQTEIMANLAVNILQLQDKFSGKESNKAKTQSQKEFDKTDKTVTVSVGDIPELSDISDDDMESEDEQDDQDIGCSLDQMLDEVDEDFFLELEKEYNEDKKFGPEIDIAMAKLAETAIEKPLKDEEYQKLTEKHLVPENCKNIKVPLVNRELRKVLKSKREGDVAMQKVTQTCSSALVIVQKALNIIKTKGDMGEMKVIFKDLFKDLEHFKDKSLKCNQGNFDAIIELDIRSKELLHWWIDNFMFSYKSVTISQPSVIFYSDASKTGWGGFNKTYQLTDNGFWTHDETLEHIIFLELKAALLTLQSLRHMLHDTHIRLYVDNTVAIQYITVHRNSTKPYKPVTKSTIARWVKTVMKSSGINIECFGPHSCRSASTSAALGQGLRHYYEKCRVEISKNISKIL